VYVCVRVGKVCVLVCWCVCERERASQHAQLVQAVGCSEWTVGTLLRPADQHRIGLDKRDVK
jgi:hypothetical protein